MSLTTTLAQYFRAHPGQWIDGRTLATIAGFYAWRSRCSDCRKLGMRIEYRQLRMTNENGQRWAVSQYRYVPESSDGVAQAL